MKYRRHDLHGLMVIDKPYGISSMGVLKKVRHQAGFCKTGHAGTLDPMATGVLILCFGKGTKAVGQLMGQTKVYVAEVDLSAFSNTDDAEGELSEVEVGTAPARGTVRELLDGLTGEIMQRPPAYSAIKVNGKRAYRLARSGEEVELPARPVRIDEIVLDEYEFPRLKLTITCGKGTYIRSLARQIGEGLGTGGYLTGLRRTAIGDYGLNQAYTVESLPEPIETKHLLPIPE